jgi:hypothetical protein
LQIGVVVVWEVVVVVSVVEVAVAVVVVEEMVVVEAVVVVVPVVVVPVPVVVVLVLVVVEVLVLVLVDVWQVLHKAGHLAATSLPYSGLMQSPMLKTPQSRGSNIPLHFGTGGQSPNLLWISNNDVYPPVTHCARPRSHPHSSLQSVAHLMCKHGSSVVVDVVEEAVVVVSVTVVAVVRAQEPHNTGHWLDTPANKQPTALLTNAQLEGSGTPLQMGVVVVVAVVAVTLVAVVVVVVVAVVAVMVVVVHVLHSAGHTAGKSNNVNSGDWHNAPRLLVHTAPSGTYGGQR